MLIAFDKYYQGILQKPLITEKAVVFEIEKGDSLTHIAQKVAAISSISAKWFSLLVIQKKAITHLKSGEYEISLGMTLPQLIDTITAGKVKQHSITFPEGWRFHDMLTALQHTAGIEHTIDAQAFIDDTVLLKKLGSAYQHAEGLFFPDTYFFTKATKDITILAHAYDKMQAVLAQEWIARDPNLPINTPYEALILASIIEKETAVAKERADIAGVFTRRLLKGMLLQTDPTVIYGMGTLYQGDITRKDLSTPTPYNTYLNRGLPPTPIALPGYEALHAALHPTQGQSLYFVARGDGTHYFSATLDEHNQAVNLFQKNH